jgi:hypothetical protein
MAGQTVRPKFTPRRVFPAMLALVVVVYMLDLGWYECRVLVPKLGAAKGSVHRVRLLAIQAKANKVEYQVDSVRPEEDLPCAHSLFPQGRTPPCWYVSKHANDPIPM